MVAMALYILKIKGKSSSVWLLLVVGAGFILDPLFITTCRLNGNSCVEYVSLTSVLHGLETVITASALLVLTLHDAQKRKKLVSIAFGIFQVLYVLLFFSQLANSGHFNTLSQYIYQTVLVVWLTWFCRDFLAEHSFGTSKQEKQIVKISVATWAFLNGVLAILLSLAHIHLLGRIKGLYFASDNAWLAQHGVAIGIIMLYLSRHLLRGERRARQIFLLISGIEVIKYAVISPHASLMTLYLLSFLVLFVLRDDFDRGVVPMTWIMRLRDLYFMTFSLLIAAFLALLALNRNSHVAVIAGQAFDHWFDYVEKSNVLSQTQVHSALLAHTASSFILTSAAVILWILFKPYSVTVHPEDKKSIVVDLLERFSKSPDDYFKLWPSDKSYFWQKDQNGFIAYKVVGSVVYGLADPISKNQKPLLMDFLSWAKAHRLKASLMPIPETSRKLYDEAGLGLLQIGSSAVVDIEHFLSSTATNKWWRWQKNRALKSGYSYVCAHPPHANTLIQQLKQVSEAWLQTGRHKERTFGLGYFDDNYLQQCVIHYLALPDGSIAAFTNQVPQPKSLSTTTIDLLRYLPETNNAMPYLLYETITTVSAQGYKHFDLGFVPFAKTKNQSLALVQAMSAGIFSSKGLMQFKNKFEPDWQPYYLAYEGDITNLAPVALNIEKLLNLKVE